MKVLVFTSRHRDLSLSSFNSFGAVMQRSSQLLVSLSTDVYTLQCQVVDEYTVLFCLLGN